MPCVSFLQHSTREAPGGEGSSSEGDHEEEVLLEFLSLQPEELWTHMMQRNGNELQVRKP